MTLLRQNLALLTLTYHFISSTSAMPSPISASLNGITALPAAAAAVTAGTGLAATGAVAALGAAVAGLLTVAEAAPLLSV